MLQWPTAKPQSCWPQKGVKGLWKQLISSSQRHLFLCSWPQLNNPWSRRLKRKTTDPFAVVMSLSQIYEFFLFCFGHVCCLSSASSKDVTVITQGELLCLVISPCPPPALRTQRARTSFSPQPGQWASLVEATKAITSMRKEIQICQLQTSMMSK